MGRYSFTAMLYLMGLACLVAAASERSWAWALGALALFGVGRAASRQLTAEAETGPQTASGKFLLVAFALLLGGIGAIAWMATR